MAVGYMTTNTLIADIKRRAMIPSSQNAIKTSDFLAHINSEIDVAIVPLMLSLHEEFFVYTKIVPLVASKSAYEIPYRAIGGKLRDLFYVDSGGNLYEMSRISPEDKTLYQHAAASNRFKYFYVQNNDIIIVPSVPSTATGSIRMEFFMRPSDLVEETRVGIVSAIDRNTGVITLTEDVPSNITASSLIDFLEVKSGHKIYSYDITVLAVDNGDNTITVAPSDIPESLVVGDHIASAGECIIPQIPSDIHPMLSQRVAARCLEALGDRDGLKAANEKISEMNTAAGVVLDNRVEGAHQKIVNRNGFLRNRRRW